MSSQIAHLRKFLLLELCGPKRLPNQVARFLEVQFLETEGRYEVDVDLHQQKHQTDLYISLDVFKYVQAYRKYLKMINNQYFKNEVRCQVDFSYFCRYHRFRSHKSIQTFRVVFVRPTSLCSKYFKVMGHQ